MGICYYFDSAISWVTAKDEICPTAASNLHIRNNIGQKSLIGGILSWIISSYVLYIAFTKGKQMLEFDEPNISSIAEEIKMHSHVNFSDISLPLLEIVQGGDSTVDLQLDDYRKYFHMRVRNIEKKFIDGELTRLDTLYQIGPC
jgi:hypothetical protein